MDERTYREALRTTARVTAVFALTGCGGAIAPDVPDHLTAPEPTTTAGVADAAPPKPVAPAPAPDASSTDPAFLACNATLSAHADGGFTLGSQDLGCCGVVLGHVSKHWEDYSKVDTNVLGGCCALVGQDGGAQPAACTPWGPPMPPAMSFATSFAEEVVS